MCIRVGVRKKERKREREGVSGSVGEGEAFIVREK